MKNDITHSERYLFLTVLLGLIMAVGAPIVSQFYWHRQQPDGGIFLFVGSVLAVATALFLLKGVHWGEQKRASRFAVLAAVPFLFMTFALAPLAVYETTLGKGNPFWGVSFGNPISILMCALVFTLFYTGVYRLFLVVFSGVWRKMSVMRALKTAGTWVGQHGLLVGALVVLGIVLFPLWYALWTVGEVFIVLVVIGPALEYAASIFSSGLLGIILLVLSFSLFSCGATWYFLVHDSPGLQEKKNCSSLFRGGVLFLIVINIIWAFYFFTLAVIWPLPDRSFFPFF